MLFCFPLAASVGDRRSERIDRGVHLRWGSPQGQRCQASIRQAKGTCRKRPQEDDETHIVNAAFLHRFDVHRGCSACFLSVIQMQMLLRTSKRPQCMLKLEMSWVCCICTFLRVGQRLSTWRIVTLIIVVSFVKRVQGVVCMDCPSTLLWAHVAQLFPPSCPNLWSWNNYET